MARALTAAALHPFQPGFVPTGHSSVILSLVPVLPACTRSPVGDGAAVTASPWAALSEAGTDSGTDSWELSGCGRPRQRSAQGPWASVSLFASAFSGSVGLSVSVCPSSSCFAVFACGPGLLGSSARGEAGGGHPSPSRPPAHGPRTPRPGQPSLLAPAQPCGNNELRVSGSSRPGGGPPRKGESAGLEGSGT